MLMRQSRNRIYETVLCVIIFLSFDSHPWMSPFGPIRHDRTRSLVARAFRVEKRPDAKEVRRGALRAREKLMKEMERPEFAEGIPPDVAKQIAFDQMAFWDYLSKAEDTTDEDGPDAERDARRIIAEMAEIEDELVEPTKSDDVIKKHRRVVQELRHLASEEGQERATRAMQRGLAAEPYSFS